MRKWLTIGLLATLDHALLSLISFVISLAFIRFGDKAQYGLYVMLLSPIYLAQGIQNAAFLSPFGTLYHQRPEDKKASIVQFLVWGQVAFAVTVVTIGFVAVLGYQCIAGAVLDIPTATALAMATLGVLIREAYRSFHYVHARAASAFVGDFLFGAIILSALAVLISSNSLTAVAVLAVTGFAGALPVLSALRSQIRPAFVFSATELAMFWAYGRWALIGVGLTWINLYVYPYIAARSFGLATVAEINAARLFMMPIAFGLPAWSNLVRPQLSKWYSANQLTNIRRLTIRSAVVVSTFTVVYAGGVIVIYPWLEPLLGPAYIGIRPLVLAWFVYFLISAVRTVLMATLMVDENGYKSLSRITFMAIWILIPSMALASQWGPIYIIGALALTELFQLFAIYRRSVPYWGES